MVRISRVKVINLLHRAVKTVRGYNLKYVKAIFFETNVKGYLFFRKGMYNKGPELKADPSSLNRKIV